MKDIILFSKIIKYNNNILITKLLLFTIIGYVKYC